YHERVLELLERSGGLRVYASCFSHQLVALWQGGTVERRRERLLGWERLELTGTHGALAGMDSLSALCMNIDEVTEVPPGAALVASSPGCACQALSYGDRMLTCQAHPEMNPHRNGAAASAAALLLCRGRPAVYRSFRRGRPDASDASSDEFMKRVAGWLAGSADPLSTGDGR
ncbi:MAG: hypothetical protein FJ313_06235, partial [Gemmatimonadetes bacterium]|nr:hypothetical protein [Gemmatimonadota bacterium]